MDEFLLDKVKLQQVAVAAGDNALSLGGRSTEHIFELEVVLAIMLLFRL